MTNHIAGKIVLIVDAGSEPAVAAAHHLAEAGATVVLGAPDVDDVRELAHELRWNGGKAMAVQACPWDIARMQDLLSEVVDMFGRVDVIVNNAGSTPTMQPAQGSRPAATNITCAWYGTSAALPHMQRRGRGHIINVAALVDGGVAAHALRAVSRRVLAELSDAMREVLWELNIRTTLISSGCMVGESAPVASQLNCKGEDGHPRGNVDSPNAFARALAAAIGHPDDMNLNEITLRPFMQHA